MVSLSFNEISIIRMLISPPKVLVNVGMRLINISDGNIYEFDEEKLSWENKGEARRDDYLQYPQLIG